MADYPLRSAIRSATSSTSLSTIWANSRRPRIPACEFAIRAAEANPEFPDVYAVRAAAEGQLGRVDAGRSTLDELLRRMPGLTVADERLNRPFARAADRARFIAGLRKAGLLEG